MMVLGDGIVVALGGGGGVGGDSDWKVSGVLVMSWMGC